MSYSGMGGMGDMGAYYEISGYGDMGGVSGGMGAYYEISGYGAVAGIRETFSAEQVWAEAQLGGTITSAKVAYDAACTSDPGTPACAAMRAEMGRINAAGGRAARAVQSGLTEMGYDPGPIDGLWGPRTDAAWKKYAADVNVQPGPGLVSYAGLKRMESALRGGEAPGKAGIGTAGWLLLAAAAAVGITYVAKKRRRRGASTALTTRRRPYMGRV